MLTFEELGSELAVHCDLEAFLFEREFWRFPSQNIDGGAAAGDLDDRGQSGPARMTLGQVALKIGSLNQVARSSYKLTLGDFEHQRIIGLFGPAFYRQPFFDSPWHRESLSCLPEPGSQEVPESP